MRTAYLVGSISAKTGAVTAFGIYGEPRPTTTGDVMLFTLLEMKGDTFGAALDSVRAYCGSVPEYVYGPVLTKLLRDVA